jgi:hypothetical protein
MAARMSGSSAMLDRHQAERGAQTAIIWEGDDPASSQRSLNGPYFAGYCPVGSVLRSALRGRCKQSSRFGWIEIFRKTYDLSMCRRNQDAVAVLITTPIGAVAGRRNLDNSAIASVDQVKLLHTRAKIEQSLYRLCHCGESIAVNITHTYNPNLGTVRHQSGAFGKAIRIYKMEIFSR